MEGVSDPSSSRSHMARCYSEQLIPPVVGVLLVQSLEVIELSSEKETVTDGSDIPLSDCFWKC